jgi:hypothetical protein
MPLPQDLEIIDTKMEVLMEKDFIIVEVEMI